MPARLAAAPSPTHEVVTYNGHDGRLTRPGSRDHLGNAKHGMRLVWVPALVPDADRLVEVVFVEVAKAPRWHDREYLGK